MMRLRIKPHRRPQGRRLLGKFNTVSLNVPTNHLHFCNEPSNQLAKLTVADEDDSVENHWGQLRDMVQSSVLDFLGSARRQHQDWFDENDAAINSLLAEKNRLHKAYFECPAAANKIAFYRRGCLVQQRLWKIAPRWSARPRSTKNTRTAKNERTSWPPSWLSTDLQLKESPLYSVLTELAY
ncbi:unnamed protein product [Schistocephalus solidus]|uniref:Uncharacterized protein n=1 Tax=Schistocephalus solidus TaxID=70667 RepID=A0A183TSU7_SCHSO|nr:unnamed protein product [Schistocephalus solidus]